MNEIKVCHCEGTKRPWQSRSCVWHRDPSTSSAPASWRMAIFARNDRRGFTLVEIMIVVVIVGMMATLSVTNFQAGQEDDALRIGVLRIADQLRVAQNYAQTGIHAGTATARAYGVYIKKPDAITSFADLSGDPVGMKDASDPEIGSPITLKVGSRSNIRIDSDKGIMVDGVRRDEVTVAFRTPNASGLVDGKTEGNSIVITLHNTRNNHTKSVTINRITGRVDTEY